MSDITIQEFDIVPNITEMFFNCGKNNVSVPTTSNYNSVVYGCGVENYIVGPDSSSFNLTFFNCGTYNITYNSSTYSTDTYTQLYQCGNAFGKAKKGKSSDSSTVKVPTIFLISFVFMATIAMSS
ncbi:uncharacterized protein RJT20DRAFT_3069 [Scheffersomyces xylosifermentans]|uniref:uncharacterized protein n=1 Tax=Scheffersomyces xylosifermentans TaxID=1304137 RepID=UPI00315DF777